MTTSLQYFLLIAKEQSIVRAAEQLYISPQNLSNHVKRLEKEYGTLFERYPHFRLTPAGEALVETLKKIDVLERGLADRLKELNEEMIGQISLGIHPIRAQVVLPRVLPAFAEEFPNVHVTARSQNEVKNIRDLQNGDLDAFFGIDTPALDEFTIIPLASETTFFVASEEMLEKHGIARDAETITTKELSDFSFLLSPPESRFRSKIRQFCDKTGIVLNEKVTVSDFSLQLNLASQGLGACFTPDTYLHVVDDLNQILPPEKALRTLDVEDFTATTRLSLVLHSMAYRSAPIKGLIRVFKEAFKEGYI